MLAQMVLSVKSMYSNVTTLWKIVESSIAVVVPPEGAVLEFDGTELLAAVGAKGFLHRSTWLGKANVRKRQRS